MTQNTLLALATLPMHLGNVVALILLMILIEPFRKRKTPTTHEELHRSARVILTVIFAGLILSIVSALVILLLVPAEA